MSRPVGCPVCQLDLKLQPVTSKKGKQFLMLSCPVDGRHFRGFIYDKGFVERVMVAAKSDG